MKFKIDLCKLRRDSRRSWRKEMDGKSQLGIDRDVSEEFVPFFSFKNQIDRSAYIEERHKNDLFRSEIAKIHALEAKLKFILRYDWVYNRRMTFPFKARWIYDEYKKITSEPDIREYLNL